MSSGWVVCAACGARIKEGRERCLRCNALLEPTRPASLWRSQELSRGKTLIAATVASVVVLGLLTILWQTWPEPVDDVAHPAPNAGVTQPPVAATTAPATETPATEPQATTETSFTPVTAGDAIRSGSVAYSVGNFESARAAYEEALAKKPDDPDILNSLGQVLVRLNRVDEAVARFERAVALAPQRWAYRFNLGHAVGELGQWNRAVTEYQTAVRLFPTDYATQYNLAMALHKKGDEQAAIPEFEKAIRLAPSEPSFHMSLGISLEKVGRVPEAVREYRQFLEMNPSSPDADKLKAHIEALSALRAAAKSP